MGCWTPVEQLGEDWQVENVSADGSAFDLLLCGEKQGRLVWPVLGLHNVSNAVMAIGAARHVGVTPAVAIEALAQFQPPKRRMELRGEIGGVRVFDDFAHHPTAITTTLAGLRANVGEARILAVLEPRSNTMKRGVHKQQLAASLRAADRCFLLQPEGLDWSLQNEVASQLPHAVVSDTVAQLAEAIVAEAQAGDQILVMSNGGFGGLHQLLLDKLAKR